jgi:hypothetical protein
MLTNSANMPLKIPLTHKVCHKHYGVTVTTSTSVYPGEMPVGSSVYEGYFGNFHTFFM